tara:strand:+ start:2084 stop:2479 length:396 start_codon:yes stop_codon:yes gene_type:complete
MTTIQTTSTNNENIYILTPQEEVDCYGEDMVQREKYNYKDPNHKPPFIGEDYIEIPADEDLEMNRLAIGSKGKYFCQITEKYNIASIWHNQNTKKIEIWGPSRKFNNVIFEINQRYQIARQIIETNKLNNT